MLLKSREIPLSEEECRLIFAKLVHGLKDMHDSCIVHRDIKLSNIMINFNRSILLQDGSIITLEDLIHFSQSEKEKMLKEVDLLNTDFDIKIADLGFSKYLEDIRTRNYTMCGTPLYMSP